MARIRRKGLEYFPLDTNFVNNRIIKRIMKHEGDRALCVMLHIFSAIYSGEGYYLQTDELTFEDIATNLFETDAAYVQRVVEEAVDYGMFDADLYARLGILTSAGIQRQYLFITKRRKDVAFRTDIRLITNEMSEDEENGDTKTACTSTVPDVTFKPQNVTSGTQSKEKKSIEKQSKENLLQPPPVQEKAKAEKAGDIQTGAGEEAETEGNNRTGAGGENRTGEEAGTPARHPVRWTRETIDALQPPSDGRRRNYDGLLENLRRYHIPENEQYAIICRSGYGLIGHPVWKGIYDLHSCGGRIRLPGRYLLSKIQG